MPEVKRTRSELEQLLDLSTQLGFKDDIAHWTAELKKLNEGEGNG